MKKAGGQSIGEYAVVIALVVGAILGMSLYVKRGIQGRLKGVADYTVLRLQATSSLTKDKFASYAPKDPTPREEMAVLLFRAVNSDDDPSNDLQLYTGEQIFADVAPGDFGYGEIGALYLADITHGTGQIDPRSGLPIYGTGQPTSRDQEAVMLYRTLGLTPYDGPQIFTDIADSADPYLHEVYQATGALYQAGITRGYTFTDTNGNGLPDPGEPVYYYNPDNPSEPAMRDQSAVMLARGFHYDTYDGTTDIFSDVSPDFWAYKEISALKHAGVTQGRTTGEGTPSLQYEPDYQKSLITTESTSDIKEIQGEGGTVKRTGSDGAKASFYGPDQPASRAQFAVALANALDKVLTKNDPFGGGLPDYTGPPIFNDVASDYWAFNSIGALYNYDPQIVAGYGDPNIFLPGDSISRAQSAVMLCRALNLDTSIYDPNDPSTWAVAFNDLPADANPFQDGAQPTYGWAEIQALYRADIVEGKCTDPPLYYPNSATNRAEEALMLYRAYAPALGLELYTTDRPLFVDVPATNLAYKEIYATYITGITDEIKDPFFREETVRTGTRRVE